MGFTAVVCHPFKDFIVISLLKNFSSCWLGTGIALCTEAWWQSSRRITPGTCEGAQHGSHEGTERMGQEAKGVRYLARETGRQRCGEVQAFAVASVQNSGAKMPWGSRVFGSEHVQPYPLCNF